MNTVTIIEDIFDPTTWQRFDGIDDVIEFLCGKWDRFPDTGQLYLNHVAESCNITPHTEEELTALKNLEGHFYVVVYPAGAAVVLAIVAIAISAVTLAMAFLLRPTTPIAPQSSPNNELGNRQNRARPCERIPDIWGNVRSTLDLLQLPYKIFKNNREYEVNYLCVGRGAYQINDCMDGTTPVSWIDGEYVAVYGPNTSPNGATQAESTPQCSFGTNPLGSVPKVVTLQQSNCVNGQVLRPINIETLATSNNVAFAYPDAIMTNGNNNLDFTQYFAASTTQSPQYLTIYANDDGVNAKDSGTGHSIAIVGTYQILDVTSTQVTLCAPGGGAPSTVCAAWNQLANFVGQESEFYHSFNICNSDVNGNNYVNNWVGPYIMEIADMNQVWSNFVSRGGLYYVDNNGHQHGYTYTVQMGVQAVDWNGNPLGQEIFQSIDLVGSSAMRTDVGSTLQMPLPLPGPCRVRAQLTTPISTDKRNQYCNQIQWRELFGVSPVTSTNFGNVTTAVAITAQTQDALSVKDRKINMDVTRMVPTKANPNDLMPSVTAASNNAADIVCAMAKDPYIGGRTDAEIDYAGIYGTLGPGGSVETYFGTNFCTQFGYTFDKSEMSFEESLGYIGNATGCTFYRQGSVLSVFFEKQTSVPTLLFSHRNKIPGSETRTVTFGYTSDYDGITIDYVDPHAPNFPKVNTTVSLYFPQDQSAKNPKKVTLYGVCNNVQAELIGWRMYQKLIYQNTAIDFKATKEATLLVVNNQILVTDNTRDDVMDGQILAVNGLALTLSQPTNLTPNKTYNIFLQHTDGSVECIPITQGNAPNTVVLNRAPGSVINCDATTWSQGATYMIALPDADPSAQRSSLFLVGEKTDEEHHIVGIKGVNYDDRYYSHDQDFIKGILTWNGVSQSRTTGYGDNPDPGGGSGSNIYQGANVHGNLTITLISPGEATVAWSGCTAILTNGSNVTVPDGSGTIYQAGYQWFLGINSSGSLDLSCGNALPSSDTQVYQGQFPSSNCNNSF